ncbi:hypothetical protein K0817_000645 [Microbacterium sp. HD4P20]|uniref:hypothetical protein n=1 Tax=Microbacterium sp. HD4P20 TaxID=2864874 RepID=UPI001C63E3FC|nr:hypothetical protein [Microbacterium sp. HD4P20]MCP2635074.1 hypothetical protein [Microbacterium sp. HD4P20]
MTVPTPSAHGGGAGPTSSKDARIAWVIGGSLLVVHAVLVLWPSSPAIHMPHAGVVLPLIWAAALTIFALGVRRQGSVVARRPVGVIALMVAALEPFLSILIWNVVPMDAADRQLTVMLGTSLQVLSLAALVVAGVVIAQAGAVPGRLRWVPLIVIGVAGGMQVLAHVWVTAVGAGIGQGELIALTFGTAAFDTLGTLLLGILAIGSTPREPVQPDDAVQVYPPAS